jgi:hypothetical protein
MRKPYKIMAEETNRIRAELAVLGITTEYTIYVTDTVRGRCKHSQKSLTVPKWAITKGKDYHIYYACHEMAHVAAPATRGNVHGPAFMEAFMRICPKHLHHFEIGYKPRLAAAAGIRKLK